MKALFKQTYKSRLMTACFAGGLALSFTPSANAAHPPLAAADGPREIIASILGQNKGSDFSKELETQLMDEALSELLEGDVSPSVITAARQAYAQSVFKPLWKRRAAEKLHALPVLFESHGLEANISEAQINALIEQRFYSESAEDKASAEIALTALWLKYTTEISGGLSNAGEAVESLDDSPARSDLVVSLCKAAESNPIDEMEGFTSSAPQYTHLRKALNYYKEGVAFTNWLAVSTHGDIIEPGDTDDRIPALRERLRAEGFLPEISYVSLILEEPLKETEATLYDLELENAVKAFQAAHTMEQDGVIGPATLTAMNESPESKITKIKAALDYWRHLDAFNQQSGDRYIWVNIPSFRAEGWNNGKMEIAMKTIVGAKYTPTPDFSDEVEYIVANPKWFLPVSLFERQKLSKLRQDPGYAAAHKYNIYDRATGQELNPYSVDWYQPGISSQIQMVQSPGPHNALGELKIIFPNQYSVYLHSTPDKHLFQRDVRTFSSGCVRLDDPVAMANWITDHDSEIDTQEFNKVLESRERKHFKTGENMAVHITYVGVTADENGIPTFHRDVYNKLAKPSFVERQYDMYPAAPIVELDDDVKQTAAARVSVSALP